MAGACGSRSDLDALATWGDKPEGHWGSGAAARETDRRGRRRRLRVELVGADGYHLRSSCSGNPRREDPHRAVAVLSGERIGKLRACSSPGGGLLGRVLRRSRARTSSRSHVTRCPFTGYSSVTSADLGVFDGPCVRRLHHRRSDPTREWTRHTPGRSYRHNRHRNWLDGGILNPRPLDPQASF